MERLTNFLSFLAPAVPLLLCWMAGGIVALVTRRRHPAVSAMVLAAVLLLAVTRIASGTAQFLLPMWAAEDPDHGAAASRAIGVLSAVCYAAGLGFLVASVFHGRGVPRE